MTSIKKGALVKGWYLDIDSYTVGIYDGYDLVLGHKIIGYCDINYCKHIIEIPAELAKQLEELGKCEK